MKLINSFGEQIDVLVEGNFRSAKTAVFVHGFGTGKNEGENIFVDISNSLQGDFRIVRFDFTGCGESEGSQEDVNFEKQAKDLKTVLDWAKKEFKGKIFIIAHSLGNLVVSKLCPDNIEKTVFSAIPNANTEYIAHFIQERIRVKGGQVNEKGISIYPRSSGEVQKVGPIYCKTLKQLDALKSVTEYAKKTQLLIIHPLQDEIVGNEYLEAYKHIPGVEYVELGGSHSYSKTDDREEMMRVIKDFVEL